MKYIESKCLFILLLVVSANLYAQEIIGTKTIQCPFFSSDIVLDGNLDELGNIAPEIILPDGNPKKLYKWQGKMDCSIRLYNRWTKNGLYVCFEWWDDNFKKTDQLDNLTTADNIILIFDPLHNGGETLYQDDSAFCLFINNQDKLVVLIWKNNKWEPFETSEFSEIEFKEKSVIGELFISWDLIGPFKPGIFSATLPFDVIINENDADIYKGYLRLLDENSELISPNYFLQMLFLKADGEPIGNSESLKTDILEINPKDIKFDFSISIAKPNGNNMMTLNIKQNEPNWLIPFIAIAYPDKKMAIEMRYTRETDISYSIPIDVRQSGEYRFSTEVIDVSREQIIYSYTESINIDIAKLIEGRLTVDIKELENKLDKLSPNRPGIISLKNDFYKISNNPSLSKKAIFPFKKKFSIDTGKFSLLDQEIIRLDKKISFINEFQDILSENSLILWEGDISDLKNIGELLPTREKITQRIRLSLIKGCKENYILHLTNINNNPCTIFIQTSDFTPVANQSEPIIKSQDCLTLRESITYRELENGTTDTLFAKLNSASAIIIPPWRTKSLILSIDSSKLSPIKYSSKLKLVSAKGENISINASLELVIYALPDYKYNSPDCIFPDAKISKIAPYSVCPVFNYKDDFNTILNNVNIPDYFVVWGFPRLNDYTYTREDIVKLESILQGSNIALDRIALSPFIKPATAETVLNSLEIIYKIRNEFPEINIMLFVNGNIHPNAIYSSFPLVDVFGISNSELSEFFNVAKTIKKLNKPVYLIDINGKNNYVNFENKRGIGWTAFNLGSAGLGILQASQQQNDIPFSKDIYWADDNLSIKLMLLNECVNDYILLDFISNLFSMYPKSAEPQNKDLFTEAIQTVIQNPNKKTYYKDCLFNLIEMALPNSRTWNWLDMEVK